MRKLLIILWLIVGSLTINAQVVKTSVVYAPPAVAASYCDEYQAVYNALDAKPGTDTASAQNTLVASAKTHGWWAEADVIYVTAQRTEAGALLNWKASTGDDNLTNTTSTAFTKYQGFTGASGTSESMSTNFTPSSEGVNYTQDDAGLAVYTRIDINAGECAIGVDQGSNDISIYPRTAGSILSRVNCTTNVTEATANSLGLSSVSRSNATTVFTYKNGAVLDADGDASNSVGLSTSAITVLSLSASSYSNNQVSFVFIGGYLTDAQQAFMFTDIETYLDFVGAGVVAP